MTTTTSTPNAEQQSPTAPRTYLNYIGGEWRSAVSGETFDNTNPAHYSEVIGKFQRSGAEDLDAAI
ncbi:MAG TPA: hypothetical protein VGP82_18395, partial [Ktedonobacterales bacterium]|nr:hypothetical protein [Ktedonobacterales bacterium]